MFSKTFLRRQTSWWTPKRKNTNISLYFLQWWLKWNIQIQTGMEEATCEKAAFVSTFQDNTEDFTIIQGPAARIRPTRLPDSYFSCESHFITHFSVTTATDNIYSFFSPLDSRLRRPGEEPVGMWSISPCVACIDKKDEKWSAGLALCQTTPSLLCGMLILSLLCVWSEVQGPQPANEAFPQRTPPKKVSLRQ